MTSFVHYGVHPIKLRLALLDTEWVLKFLLLHLLNRSTEGVTPVER